MLPFLGFDNRLNHDFRFLRSKADDDQTLSS